MRYWFRMESKGYDVRQLVFFDESHFDTRSWYRRHGRSHRCESAPAVVPLRCACDRGHDLAAALTQGEAHLEEARSRRGHAYEYFCSDGVFRGTEHGDVFLQQKLGHFAAFLSNTNACKLGRWRPIEPLPSTLFGCRL